MTSRGDTVFKKALFSLIFSLLVLIPTQAQETKLTLTTANKVEGLELPADKTVKNDEGFITLQAKTKGDVKWLVISATKIKYVTIPQDNSIIISIPVKGGTITVFAISLVDGKMTEFARTNLTITANGDNSPPPGPANGPLHVTFIVDLNSTTPELAQILNSQSLRTYITSKGNYFRLYDTNSPILQQKKLDAVVKKVGGSAIMVVQRNDGYVLDARAVPSTEAEVINLINSLGGK